MGNPLLKYLYQMKSFPVIQDSGELNGLQLAEFQENGFLKIPDFVSSHQVQALRDQAEKIVNGSDLADASRFSTEEHSLTAELFFIESGDKIRCFFEENAFDQESNLKQDKLNSINKIGHAIHDFDPVFEETTYTTQLAGLVKSLGFHNPLMVQSQYIFKQPRIGGRVSPHQDSTFIYTNPPTCIGFWIAIEDSTIENGCLMAIPGSHHSTITKRFLRNGEGNNTFFKGEDQTWDTDEMIPLEAKSGSLILLHGNLAHMSNPNLSSRSRQAYIIHLVDCLAQNWPPDNWLQRPIENPFRDLFKTVTKS